MKIYFVNFVFLWTLIFPHWSVASDGHAKLKNEVRVLHRHLAALKNSHSKDIMILKGEIEELKRIVMKPNNEVEGFVGGLPSHVTSNRDHKHSIVLHQLHNVKDQARKTAIEIENLGGFARVTETKLGALAKKTDKYMLEMNKMHKMVSTLHSHFEEFTKKVKEQCDFKDNEIVVAERKDDNKAHKLRHHRMDHVRVSRVFEEQSKIMLQQQALQDQIANALKRIEYLEEPNMQLMSAKFDGVELSIGVLKKKIYNITQRMSDFDKVHASVLELREDLEGMENKADKIVPEFRKEISKLDVNYAQLNAQSSYLKESQESLRLSVKAIAVSVSNAIDRADSDRATLKHINESLTNLEKGSKQHTSKLNDHILKAESNHDGNHTVEIPLSQIMSEVKELQPVEREYEDLVQQLPRDCSSVSGPPDTYLIRPGHTPLDAWCSNKTTLLQRRSNGSVEFNRKYVDYVKGFGDPAGEYWMGLQTMHLLTADNCSGMRIDMVDIYGGYWYAEYDYFYVGGVETGYILEVSGYKGNASDAFEYQNHMEFSAIDHDRDISNTHCAGNYEGGWWFSHCQHVNINGKYSLGLTWFDSGKNEWIAVATSYMHMLRTC